jgi:flagellar protein FliL
MSEQPATEELPKKKKNKKLLFIIIGAVLALGGGGFFMFGGSKPTEEVEEKEVEHEYGHLELKEFVVNLKQSGSYLKVLLQIKYDLTILNSHLEGGAGGGSGHGGGGVGGGEDNTPAVFTSNLPTIRDRIIQVLSSKTGEEVLSVEGKENIKEELIEVINDILGFDEDIVVEILFTEFIVQ